MGQLLPAVHVLVVDDSPELREALTAVLEREGAVVTAAGTAERALDLLQRLRPDVLLRDLEMPDQGGLTPAACITGSTGPEDRARVLRAGFQYHIPKPFGMARLLGVVGILALKP